VEVVCGKALKKLIPTMKKLSYVNDAEIIENTLRLYVRNSEAKLLPLLHHLQKNKVQVKSISLKQPTLEDVFMH